MPLPEASDKSQKGINKQVSSNIDELVHHGTKQRSHAQIVAIAEATARGENRSKKSTKPHLFKNNPFMGKKQ